MVKNFNLLIFIIVLIIFSCNKDEKIDLNRNYLTVTDVKKYCERECNEDLDLLGVPVKVRGHLKRDLHDNYIHDLYLDKVVFYLLDIRNENSLTVQIMNDSTNISEKLDNILTEMIFLQGKISYGFDPTSNKGCDKDLFIEIYKENDIKID